MCVAQFNPGSLPVPTECRYTNSKKRDQLDENVIETICLAVSRGIPLGAAAESLGIQPSRLGQWKIAGEKYLEVGNGDEHDELCARMATGLRMASGEYRCELSNMIHNDDDWFRFLKIAERRDPQNYQVDPKGGREEEYDDTDEFL